MGLVKVDAIINGQYRYNDESVYNLIGKSIVNKENPIK